MVAQRSVYGLLEQTITDLTEHDYSSRCSLVKAATFCCHSTGELEGHILCVVRSGVLIHSGRGENSGSGVRKADTIKVKLAVIC